MKISKLVKVLAAEAMADAALAQSKRPLWWDDASYAAYQGRDRAGEDADLYEAFGRAASVATPAAPECAGDPRSDDPPF